MPDKKTNITSAEGHFGEITFSVTAPPDQVKAVVAFIRNLARLYNGKS